MNYYKHHIGDFDRATRHLTRVERSIYRDLLDVYYDTEQALTLDMQALCRRVIARTDEEATAVEQVLNEFFTKTPSGWYHDRCEEEIDAFKSSNSQKSAAGKASAAKREAKRQQALNGISTDVEQTLNGTPTNHKPLTINHKPLTNSNTASPPARKRAIPEDFVVSQRVEDWADKNGYSKGRITANYSKFTLWAKREGKKYSDWDAALMTAIRDDWAKVGDGQSGKHNGFDAVDYRKGVGDDGSF